MACSQTENGHNINNGGGATRIKPHDKGLLRLLSSLELDLEEAGDEPVLCDNKQTVQVLQKDHPVFKTKLKHVDIQNHWLRQEVQHRHVRVCWIPTSSMPADGLTKALPRQRHEEFVRMLNLVNVNHLIEDSKKA